MLKKVLFLMLIICPLMLSANEAKSRCPQTEVNVPLVKGGERFTKEEKQLVHWLWHIMKTDRTVSTLKKILTHDFEYIDISNNLLNKKAFITLATTQFPQILSYQITGLHMTRKGNAILAYYTLAISTTISSGTIPLSEMNVFQKVNGTWKVKGFDNMDLFGAL